MRLLTVLLLLGLFVYGLHTLLELAISSVQFTNVRSYGAPLELPR